MILLIPVMFVIYSWFLEFSILGIFDIINSCDAWYIFLISGIYDIQDLYIYDILDFWYPWFMGCFIYLISGNVDSQDLWYSSTSNVWYAWFLGLLIPGIFDMLDASNVWIYNIFLVQHISSLHCIVSLIGSGIQYIHDGINVPQQIYLI